MVVNSACKTILSAAFSDFKKFTDSNLAAHARGASTEGTLSKVLANLTTCISGLDAVLAKTDPKNPDRKNCQKMLDQFKNIDVKVKATITERRNYDKLLSIKNSIYSMSLATNLLDDTFVSKKRRFCREGSLVKVCRSANKTFMFWLLSDMLIYASPVANGSYTLNRCIQLSQCRVYSKDHEGAPAFEVLSDKKTFIVLPPTPEIRDLWFNDLNDNIEACMYDRTGSFATRNSISEKSGDDLREVTVREWQERQDEGMKGTSTYYSFQVTTWGEGSWQVTKRYSEVLALHTKMKKDLGHESLVNFPFPVKSMFNSGDKLKNKRKASFELYFRLLL